MPHYEKVTLLKVKFSNLYLMGRLISGHTKELTNRFILNIWSKQTTLFTMPTKRQIENKKNPETLYHKNMHF